jgi:hypothetical protein
VPVEDCGNVPLLGLTSSSKPSQAKAASVFRCLMFNCRVQKRTVEDFIPVAVIHIEWVVVDSGINSVQTPGDFRVRFWFGVVADFCFVFYEFDFCGCNKSFVVAEVMNILCFK